MNRFARWILRRAQRTPYFDIYDAADQLYMVRWWLLGSLSLTRNADNPTWDQHYRARIEREARTWRGQLYQWLTKHIAIRAHYIARSDDDRALHDHPFSFVSLVLSGGYWEVTEPTELYYANYDRRRMLRTAAKLRGDQLQPWLRERMQMCGIRWRAPGSIAFRRAETLHRIIIPDGQPALTICVIGKRRRGWGFATAEGWKPWRDYLGGE